MRIRILIGTTVVPIRILIGTTVVQIAIVFPDCHTMESTPQSDKLGSLTRTLQNQCCECQALQAEFILKISSTRYLLSIPGWIYSQNIFYLISSISFHFSPFSSIIIFLFLLISFSFFPFFPGDNPQSWERTSIYAIGNRWLSITRTPAMRKLITFIYLAKHK